MNDSSGNIEPVKLGNRMVGPGFPVFLVADIANCHEGDFETAKRMIERIAHSGVDAVKFQLHVPEAEMTRSHPKFETQTRRSLPASALTALKAYAESLGLYFLCTPFSRQAADELEAIGVDAFKIGSGETSDFPFLEYVARKRKPMILSTGMTAWQEIEGAVEIVKRHGAPFLLLHCVSIYPPSYERLNLGVMAKLRERFRVPVGLSDHTTEIYSAIAAVPLGVHLIEKHYTLDRSQSGTSDHKVSLEPQEWDALVDAVRKIERACGDEKRIFAEEEPVVSWARHGVIAARDLTPGDVITADMVTTKRPLYGGIHAKELPSVLGRKVRVLVKADSILHWADIETGENYAP
ncbi:N-acetylneuraminate synthase family protein [Candidatus Parcubacteria bacterium]|nr:N-acetylneuraminate synthase family protein [Candidatus Parcubacteria bacterium]